MIRRFKRWWNNRAARALASKREENKWRYKDGETISVEDNV